MRIYVKKTENRITFKIKTGYYLQLVTSETMKLLRSTRNEIAIEKNGKNLLHLEITEVVSIHCIIVNNDLRLNSRILYTLISKKASSRLLEISAFSYIEVWFIDQDSQPLEIEDRVN